MNFTSLAVACAAVSLSVAATGVSAATANINLTPSNSGGNTVFSAAPNGNLLGLFTITSAEVGDTIDLSFVQGEQISGVSILNIFAGDPSTLPPAGYQSGSLSLGLFENANSGLTIGALSSGSGSVYDALFIEFDVAAATANGVIAGFQGTSTFSMTGNSVEIAYSAPDTAPIPVPAALPFLLTAFAGFGVLARRKKA